MSQKEPEGFPEDYVAPPKSVPVVILRPLHSPLLGDDIPPGCTSLAHYAGFGFIEVENKSDRSLSIHLSRPEGRSFRITIASGSKEKS